MVSGDAVVLGDARPSVGAAGARVAATATAAAVVVES